MTGEAIIAELKNLQPIEGADRIVQGTIFGETVIVSKDHVEGEIGVLFDCETQLSEEFCKNNNLFRHSNLNGDASKTGYLEDDRRVRAIRLKGVKCSGLWLPISCLNYTHMNGPLPNNGNVGQQFTSWAGHEICKKYVNPKTKSAKVNKQGKARENEVPTFKEHVDTDQFMRNQHVLKPGQLVIITEKLHGTSCRVGNLATVKPQTLWQKFCTWMSIGKWGNNIVSYKHVVGSRRVTKSVGDTSKEGNSYYEHDIWSKTGEVFRDKLVEGETVYYEIVGYLPDGASIMPGQSNEKLKKFMDKDEYKEFVQKYGDRTSFNYGCSEKESKIYVYRITLTNEDGHTVDYSWDQVKNRCEQLGVNHVPELGRYLVKEWVNSADDRDKYIADQYGNKFEHIVENLAEQDSEMFPAHIREGVCVRVENGGLTPKFLKHKAYLFKVLEGIIKDTDQGDLEEEQG